MIDPLLREIVEAQLGQLTMQCALLGRRIKQLEAELEAERALKKEACQEEQNG